MIDLKMIYIFLLGLFLSLLYYIEEIIEEQEYKEKSLVVIGMLALIKAILGGILIVLIFYSLQDLKISFSLFGKEITLGLWANLFIAGTASVFGSDVFKIIKKKVDLYASKESN